MAIRNDKESIISYVNTYKKFMVMRSVSTQHYVQKYVMNRCFVLCVGTQQTLPQYLLNTFITTIDRLTSFDLI